MQPHSPVHIAAGGCGAAGGGAGAGGHGCQARAGDGGARGHGRHLGERGALPGYYAENWRSYRGENLAHYTGRGTLLSEMRVIVTMKVKLSVYKI